MNMDVDVDDNPKELDDISISSDEARKTLESMDNFGKCF